MKNENKAIGYALVAVLLWSTVATAFKLTLNYFSPLQMVAVAATVSAITLGILLSLRQGFKHVLQVFSAHPWYFLALGAINPVVYYLVLFEAYARLPASQAQPLNYTWAIALTFMAAIFLKQKIRKRDWTACILGYAGVLVIATQGNFTDFSQTNWVGVGLALLSTFLWASYWILNTRHESEPVTTLFLCFALASPPLLIATTWLEGWHAIPWQGWFAVSYVGVFEMGITFVFWLKAMRFATNTSTISNLIFISPFISLVLLSVILDETIGLATIAGLGFIVTGLLVQQWRRRESSPPPAL